MELLVLYLRQKNKNDFDDLSDFTEWFSLREKFR